MKNAWYIRRSGKILGPFDSASLTRMASQGQIGPDTDVRRSLEDPWVKAIRVKGLFPNSAQNTIPLPEITPQSSPAERPMSNSDSGVSRVEPPAIPLRDNLETIVPTQLAGRGYVDSNLLPGETVVYRAAIHRLIFFEPAFYFALTLVAFTVTAVSSREISGWMIIVGLSSFVLGFYRSLLSYITYTTFEGAVTTKRVILKTGLIRRSTMELLHGKIDALAIEQGLFGRIFNFGTVVVAVAVEKQSFWFIADPLRFRREVQARQIG